MALKFYTATVKIGRKKFMFYVEADQYMSEPDLKDKLTALATMDFLTESSDDDEYEDVTVDIDMEPMEESEFIEGTVFSNYGHLRTELSCTMLTNPSDIIYSFIRYFAADISDEPYGLLVDASCDQDADVSYLGIANHDGKSYQDIVMEGQKDCLMQLRRYFSVDGTTMRRGILVIAAVPPNEYDEMCQERELALAI